MSSDYIVLAHGAGGELSHRLIDDIILPTLGDTTSSGLNDSAHIESAGNAMFTTDSFVVDPLFFPGGSIGSLAINGTVNDLAVAGAIPDVLSLALILEEGLPFEVLRKILDDVAVAARGANVTIATGDTKVVPRGKGDLCFITTSGIGRAGAIIPPGPTGLKVGDTIIVSGSIGDHGMAVMAARDKLPLGAPLKSDCAPIVSLTSIAMETGGSEIRCMRDPTRGGLAATLTEWARASNVGITVEVDALPTSPAAQSVAEILGIDLIHVANEGKVVLAVASETADAIVECWRQTELGRQAQRIATVTDSNAGLVIGRSAIGTERVIDLPAGELLPRIC